MSSERRATLKRPPHRLDPLLRPRSVAIVGASPTADSMGDWCLENLVRGGYDGHIYPVNPRHAEIRGLRCYPSLTALPGPPELVMFAIADRHLEAALEDAITVGARAVLIMSALTPEDDGEPPLGERIRRRIREAELLACGANGMGYYNVRDGVWACGFDSRRHEPPGRISLISHSGAGMSGLIDSDERLAINFAVSTGNELGITMDEYLDFALDLPETRAVGLFMETARNPAGLVAALEKAARKRVPVAAVKVGRTARSAALTVAHSGALAGVDASFDALFDRYGVARVRDMDELATALILLAEFAPIGPGGLVTLHDSGGERQLLADLASDAGVPLTELSPASVAALETLLDPGLPALNPLDAWSRGGPGAGATMAECLSVMLADPGTAIGAVVHDRAPDGLIYPGYIGYMERAHAATGKPVALVAARQGTGCEPRVVEATRRGYPVLDGLPAFLRGVRALFDWRDFLARPVADPPAIRRLDSSWRTRLERGETLGEADSLALIRAAGLPANDCHLVDDAADLPAVASELRYPLALKAAAERLWHKSERGGVVLGIGGEAELLDAYRDLSSRLGPRAVLAPMVEAGVEMLLGARYDPQFGPVVLVGFGGIHAELMHDVAFLLPPFDAAAARRKIDGLGLRPLLDGFRGRPAADVEAYCELAAGFSVLAAELGDALAEADLNPVIVTPRRAIAVDALMVGRRPGDKEQS